MMHHDSSILFRKNGPSNLVKSIVSFLSCQEALRFLQVNKWLYHHLSLSTVHFKLPILSNLRWNGYHFIGPMHNDDPANVTLSTTTPSAPKSKAVIQRTKIPIVCQKRVHSVVLKGHWKIEGSTRGGGDCEGRIFIFASPSPPSSVVMRSPTNSRLVLESNMAPFLETESLHLEFRIRPEEQYYFRYDIGGGGTAGTGNTLHIIDLHMKLLLWDEEDQYLCKNLMILDQQERIGILCCNEHLAFYLGLLQRMCQTLLQRLTKQADNDAPGNDQVDDDDCSIKALKDFLQSRGIDVNRKSLRALDEITSSVLNQI